MSLNKIKENLPVLFFSCSILGILFLSYLEFLDISREQYSSTGYRGILNAIFVIVALCSALFFQYKPKKRRWLKVIIATYTFSGAIFLIAAFLSLFLLGTEAFEYFFSNIVKILFLFSLLAFPIVLRYLK